MIAAHTYTPNRLPLANLLLIVFLELHVLIYRRLLIVYGPVILVIQVSVNAIELIKVGRFQALSSVGDRER